MRIVFTAGEASGDAYAAAIVEELRKTGGEFQFEGIGGKRLGAAIGPLIVDSSSWGAISIVQGLRVFARARFGAMLERRRMLKGKPGLYVAIDFGFFNVRQSRWAKKRGWKVLYFMQPSSWKREPHGRSLISITDAVVSPFPWSAEILKEMGMNAFFFGHPIKQLIRMHPPVRKDPASPRLAILPGSRGHELERNMMTVADLVKEPSGIPTLEFAISPNFDIREVEERWKRMAPGRNDLFTQGDVYGVLGRATAAIVCSGTATIEAALMRCPHVVVYRITKAMAREGKLIGFKKPRFISIPNVVLERELVPEFAGLDLPVPEIRTALLPLLRESPERNAQLKGFEEIDQILGPDDAITKTASLICGL